YGLREKAENEELGLIYSRINNPDLEILENRLSLWDEADDCAVFESGMSAITTVLLEFLKPGDLLLYSTPLYGGTDHFIHDFLKKIHVDTLAFKPWQTQEEIMKMIHASVKAEQLAMANMEAHGNPTDGEISIDVGEA